MIPNGNSSKCDTSADYNLLVKPKKSLLIAKSLESIFKKIGYQVSGRPYLFIGITVCTTLLCSLGFLRFNPESRPEKLWIPSDSDFVQTIEWKEKNFHETHRKQMILMEGDNVLQPSFMYEMQRLKEEITAIQVQTSSGETVTKEDKCLRIPELGKLKDSWLLRSLGLINPDQSTTNQTDWSLILGSDTYCQIFESLPSACLELGLLDMWTEEQILTASLTQDDIIEAVNTVTTSALYGFPIDFARFLGGITRNETGHIVGAKTMINQWILTIDRNSLTTKSVLGSGMSGEVDEGLFLWEGRFLEVALNETARTKGVAVYPQAKRSFAEVSGKAIMSDVRFLVLGNIILYVYVFMMLGKFNMVETRPVLVMLGFASIFLSVICAFGVCSGLGIVYAPLHNILPLILLGLGVDDMFVIVQSWENLDKTTDKTLDERLPETLQKAGVAIFVTSLTDFMAFSIGSMTSLPALRSFCLYSAVGVAFLFTTQIIFFFACFTLDQRRMEEGRNGFFWCIKHSSPKQNRCSKANLMSVMFGKFAELMMTPKMKLVALATTITMTGLCIWGVTNLRQEFDPIWFIPQSTYLFKFLSKAMKNYPEAGATGDVFLEGTALTSELSKLQWLSERLDESPFVSKVHSWHAPLMNYTMEKSSFDINMKDINDSLSSSIFGDFLFSPSGIRFQSYFSFDQTPMCGEDVSTAYATKIRYTHTNLHGRDEQIRAMEAVKSIVRDANFSGFASATAPAYCGWEGDKIIARELAQNLSLALIAVLVMTSLLVANIIASLLVFVCVLLTLIDVMALMAVWGLTIDTVTCINLVLCVGLSVDYSAHIALHFMKATGTRNERAKASLKEIGPAVLNGAVSTFLAFVLLANSDSHVFLSFFKIFFGVFIFGVFQGLVFLPVMLSLIGPPPYCLEETHVDTNQREQLQSLTTFKSP